MLIKNYKENGRLYSNLIVLSLSEISRKSDSRAYFLTCASAKQRETRLCEKNELRKEMKKRQFFVERRKFCFCWCLVVVHRDILKKEQIRGSKLELGRVWNDDV